MLGTLRFYDTQSIDAVSSPIVPDGRWPQPVISEGHIGNLPHFVNFHKKNIHKRLHSSSLLLGMNISKESVKTVRQPIPTTK